MPSASQRRYPTSWQRKTIWAALTALCLILLIAFLQPILMPVAIATLLTWLIPTISMQSAAAARELPAYTNKARDKFVDVIYRYNQTFGAAATLRSKRVEEQIEDVPVVRAAVEHAAA